MFQTTNQSPSFPCVTRSAFGCSLQVETTECCESHRSLPVNPCTCDLFWIQAQTVANAVDKAINPRKNNWH